MLCSGQSYLPVRGILPPHTSAGGGAGEQPGGGCSAGDWHSPGGKCALHQVTSQQTSGMVGVAVLSSPADLFWMHKQRF